MAVLRFGRQLVKIDGLPFAGSFDLSQHHLEKLNACLGEEVLMARSVSQTDGLRTALQLFPEIPPWAEDQVGPIVR